MSGEISVSPCGRMPSFGFEGAADAFVDTAEREHPTANSAIDPTTKTRSHETRHCIGASSVGQSLLHFCSNACPGFVTSCTYVRQREPMSRGGACASRYAEASSGPRA